MNEQVILLLGIMTIASCTVLHQIPTPISFNNYGVHQYGSSPGYDFVYQGEDRYTADANGQAEAKNGHIVQGQYPLPQPDGRRMVDYRADSYNGYRATTVDGSGNHDVASNGRHGQQGLSRQNLDVNGNENLRNPHSNTVTNGNTHNGALTQPTIIRNVIIHPLPTPDPWTPAVWRR